MYYIFGDNSIKKFIKTTIGILKYISSEKVNKNVVIKKLENENGTICYSIPLMNKIRARQSIHNSSMAVVGTFKKTQTKTSAHRIGTIIAHPKHNVVSFTDPNFIFLLRSLNDQHKHITRFFGIPHNFKLICNKIKSLRQIKSPV